MADSSSQEALKQAKGKNKYALSKVQYMELALPKYESPAGFSSVASTSKLYNALGQKTKMVTNPDQAASDIVNMSGGKIGQEQAWELVQTSLSNNVISRDAYYQILDTVSPRVTNDAVSKAQGHGGDNVDAQRRLEQYQNRLFNFFADTSKFATGTLTINGTTGVEYGKRLTWTDPFRNRVWEAYVESVSHHFDFSAGWTTEVGFTRALSYDITSQDEYKSSALANGFITNLSDQGTDIGQPIFGDYWKRFDMFWGHGQPFTGGFFGEQPLASVIDQAMKRQKGNTPSGIGSSSPSSGLKNGGMTLKEGQKWMIDNYQNVAITQADIGNAYPGTPDIHDNCTAFSNYFVKKYTTLTPGSGNGKDTVNSMASANSGKVSDTPTPYSVFSIQPGGGGGVLKHIGAPGHTGVILGISGSNAVVGSASYDSPYTDINSVSSGVSCVAIPVSEMTSANGWSFFDCSKALNGIGGK